MPPEAARRRTEGLTRPKISGRKAHRAARPSPSKSTRATALPHPTGPESNQPIVIIVSGRSGVVSLDVVQAQRQLLVTINEKLDALGAKRAGAEALEPLAQELLTVIKAPADRQKQFARRLIYGLRHYYMRRYHPSSHIDNTEE